jgi:16S rRNA (cytosine1402-N4)-methyltransferase
VLAREVRELLAVRPGETVIDCTFGAGGHAALLAEDLDGHGRFVAIDRDAETARYLRALRGRLGPSVELRSMHGAFAGCLERLLEAGVEADAVLMDLGVSSMQLDQPARGFSYAQDAPLDMRMDTSAEMTAADIVNDWDEVDLSGIFWRFGEERYSRQIAKAIVARRERAPYTRTLELVETIKSAIPTPARFGQGHPAKRVFQALRIAVNDELAELDAGLDRAMALTAPGGRVAVIAFHSLEDRMVKQRFRDAARGCICPPDLPVCGCGREPEFRVVNHRALKASVRELEENPRAASARLRVAQREVR